ncbi:MAG: hypothetical protein AAGA97_00415 [Pseudomonadota bacterium]
MVAKRQSNEGKSTYQQFREEHPWPTGEVLQNLPRVRWDFGRSRDPLIAKQMDDLNKTETERREEETRRQARMVVRDKPQHNLRPPKSMARGSDRRKFASQWLREQRDAAMEQARKFELARRELSEPGPRQRQIKVPER